MVKLPKLRVEGNESGVSGLKPTFPGHAMVKFECPSSLARLYHALEATQYESMRLDSQ